MLNEQVLLLSKKHGQLRQAITKMVQVVMSFLDETPNLDKKLSVIETLRTVTEGKIFVEVERARVTRILSNIKKEQGDITAATDILCELQVETFGSMSRREKTEFILEQVALCIEKGDWTQAQILSRKISTRFFSRRPAKSSSGSSWDKIRAGGVPGDRRAQVHQNLEAALHLARHRNRDARGAGGRGVDKIGPTHVLVPADPVDDEQVAVGAVVSRYSDAAVEHYRRGAPRHDIGTSRVGPSPSLAGNGNADDGQEQLRTVMRKHSDVRGGREAGLTRSA